MSNSKLAVGIFFRRGLPSLLCIELPCIFLVMLYSAASPALLCPRCSTSSIPRCPCVCAH
ncbi:hypothetical protein BDQ94DRAFT_152268 [Aspergillus welwitschiae]|uniref:Uncharacterized protein n=1 Tax=Aspergillus welwitschiae TaxID=1341132 RepID=A0A3F3PNA4_9EURO|nr:hypothetical protein BDQ94DRAFT_152268 [Aspergillus welwitschiae]RDH28389.1 hypothetical protein BDQ94DRAFT_152268 [Aspergillus welwitschiae]